LSAYCSFSSKILFHFSSVSTYLLIFSYSSLSLSSASDISPRNPNPGVSVGSYPVVLTIGIFSSSLIYLISSSFLASSRASSSHFHCKASLISLLISSLIFLFSCIFSCTFSVTTTLYSYTSSTIYVFTYRSSSISFLSFSSFFSPSSFTF
jgi:hypothetical protein